MANVTSDPIDSSETLLRTIDTADAELGNLRESNFDAVELRRNFEADGYVYVRGVLDSQLVSQAASEFSDVLHGLGMVESSHLPPIWTGLPVDRMNDDALYETAALSTITDAPALRDLGNAVFGEDVFVARSVNVRYALPGDGPRTTPAHQDNFFVGPSPEFATFWVPLIDLTPDNGPLALAESSHVNGLLPHVEHVGSESYIFRGRPQHGVSREFSRWLTADFQIGDVLMFNSWMVHRALANLSDLVRLSIDVRVQPQRLAKSWQFAHTIPEARELRATAFEVGVSVGAAASECEELIREMMKRGVPPEPKAILELLRVLRAARNAET